MRISDLGVRIFHEGFRRCEGFIGVTAPRTIHDHAGLASVLAPGFVNCNYRSKQGQVRLCVTG
jgi:hypothetical protein